IEEPVPFVQVQGRREGRQGPDHLGRQQGREAHRRSSHCITRRPTRDLRGLADEAVIAETLDHRRVRVFLEESMRFDHRRAAQAAVCALTLVAALAFGQGNTVDEIAKYRAALQEGNPAELWEARGEDLWKQKRGPKGASLEACDLGLGPGVVKGAYAQLPRYFADADRVMDLESRIVWCMMTLQGGTEADAKRG